METSDPQEAHPHDHNIWVGLTYDDPLVARAWLRELGFVDGILVEGEAEGEVQHSEMLWPEGGRVMVSSRRPRDPSDPSDPSDPRDPSGRIHEASRGGGVAYVVVDDPDAVWARAVAVGAQVTRPLEETDYGSRGFSVTDLEGNSWSFGTYAG